MGRNGRIGRLGRNRRRRRGRWTNRFGKEAYCCVYHKLLGIAPQVSVILQGYKLEVVFTIAMPIILTGMLAALPAGLSYIVPFSKFSFGGGTFATMHI